MGKKHRISAGAITIQDGKVLLVRYDDRHGGSYLVGPGGGVEYDNETFTQALQREVKEETGVEVSPLKLLIVEDLLTSMNRMAKIWFLCDVDGGKLGKTEGAIEEGIIEAGWYTRDELDKEVVYPAIIKDNDWESFFSGGWEAKYLELRETDF